MRRGHPALIGMIALFVLAGAFLYFAAQQGQPAEPPEEAQTFASTPTPRPGPTSTAAASLLAAAIPAGAARPPPREEIYHGCPGEGDGTDPELNRLKNRIDPPAAPAPIPFQALEELAWPPGVARKHMSSWPAADRAAVARYNGTGVAVEAFLIRVQSEGAESNNCHSTASDDVDFHLWIGGNRDDDRDRSIVAEMNPRLRALHPAWNLATLRPLAAQRTHVRFTGWTMLDPEHPDQVGKTRGTIWEIHPITAVQVDQGGGQWQTLDR